MNLPIHAPGYDPIKAGANCPKCPLFGLPVVPPEGNANSLIAFVAQNPGPKEEEHRPRMPLVGRSGRLYEDTLRDANIRRKDVWTTNAVLCRPRNTAGKDTDPPPLAIECCRPRLMKELEGKKVWVLMGAKAVATATPLSFRNWEGKPRKITSIAGYPEQIAYHGHAAIAIASVHPAFVLRTAGRGYLPLFIETFKKARRFWEAARAGKEEWIPNPEVRIASTLMRIKLAVVEAKRALDRGWPVVVDTETTKAHPLVATLKCVGLTYDYKNRKCMTWVVPIADGSTLAPWWGKDQKKVEKLLRELFNHKEKTQ